MRRKDRELTSKEELLSILEEADVCRIAIQTGKAPYIVPLNYGYSWVDRLVIYFHSAGEGRKIDLMQKNGTVGFEIDTAHELVQDAQACNWGMKYKSIIGTGNVVFIEDEKEKALTLQAIMKKYGFPGHPEFNGPMLQKTKVYKLIVEEISGKQKK
jgi:uncharacterized protein